MASILETVSGAGIVSFKASAKQNDARKSSPFPASLKASPSSSVLRRESSLAGSSFTIRGNNHATYSLRRPHVVRIDAAKRVTKGRNYVLSSTLVVQEGKQDAVNALCKNILEWAAVRKVRRFLPLTLIYRDEVLGSCP